MVYANNIGHGLGWLVPGKLALGHWYLEVQVHMSSKLPPSPDFAKIDAGVRATETERSRIHAVVGNLIFAWSNNESMFIYVLMILLRTDFDAAAIVFVTLNTTRARLDLIRRLAKTKLSNQAMVRRIDRLIERFNDCTKIRNEFNHCIYQLNEKGQITHTGVLRITENKTGVQYVVTRPLDGARLAEIVSTIRRLNNINRDMWALLPELEGQMEGSSPSASRSTAR
jgi:hypothetical protein